MNKYTLLIRSGALTLLLFLSSSSWAVFPNDPTGWSQLQLVRYHWAWSDEYEMEIPIPSFPLALRDLEGSDFTLSGFYLPVELDKGEIFLSMQPYTSCFFCGGAGPETVAEVHFEGRSPKLSLDDLVTVRGRLVLNKDDYEHLFFILEEATIVDQP